MRQDQAGSSGENDLPKHLSSTYLLWLPGKIGLWFFAAVVSALTAAQLWESRPHSYLDKHDTISFPSDKSRIAQGGGKECDITDHSTLLASKRDIFIIHLAEMQDHSKKSFYEITLRCFHIWSWKSVKRLVSDSQLCYVNHLTSQIVLGFDMIPLQRVPALRAFWDLEKTVLHEIHVSGTVVNPLLTQKSPTCTYIS